jgi:cytochrome P450
MQRNSKSKTVEEVDQFEKDAKVESKSGDKVFTQQEIEDALISNALLLFFAGFDTTSTGFL